MSFGDINRVNTNLQSLNSQFSLNKINSRMADNQLKLSTGLRINKAEDDAAGFSIASKLSGRISGLEQANRNVGDAKSMLDVAETGMNSIMDTLVDMKAKATQASTDSIGESERGYIADQLESLAGEINNIVEGTEFQGTNLLGWRGEASHTGEDISSNFGGSLADATDTISLDDTDVTLSEVGGLDGSSTAFTIDDVANALQSDINDTFDGSAHDGQTFTVGTEGDSLTITADGKSDMTITASAATESLGLTTDTGSNVSTSGSSTGSLDFQVGEGSSDKMSVNTNDLTISALFSGVGDSGNISLDDGANGSLSIDGASSDDFRTFIDNIDSAIESVATATNQIGIDQNSLSIKQENLAQSISSNSAARSRIEDADFAKVQSESVKLQIMQQTATSALAQANSSPQAVLGFLGG